MTDVSLHVDDAGIRQLIDALPQTIFKAQRSAIQTTTTWAKREEINRMAIKTGIPSSVFRRFRVSSVLSQERGKVYLGVKGLKATYAGKLSQDESGADAGAYHFPGAFISTMRSGHAGIFKRKAAQRLPIAEQYVQINYGIEVRSAVAREAQIELKKRFAEKVMELNPGIE
jgi:hypothetical protein